MRIDWIEKLQGLLNTHDDMSMGNPASDKEINEAQSSLEVVFPLQLKAYLKTFGHLEIGHNALYGLGPGIPDYLSLVKETLGERHTYRPYIPVHLLPIQNDGAGNHYCLDLSSNQEDPPIVFWSHDDDESQIPESVADSFTLWLLEVADESFKV
jgi:cell wall assembly regulator SMI1